MAESLRGIIGLEGFDADAAGYRLHRYTVCSPVVWGGTHWVGKSEFHVKIWIGEETVFDGPSYATHWPQKILEHARASGALGRYEQMMCSESPLFAAKFALAEAEGRLRAFLEAPLAAELPPNQRATADVAARRMLSDPAGDAGLAALRRREDGFKSAVVACRERLASVEASLTVGGLLNAARGEG